MKSDEEYRKAGFMVLGKGKIQDKYGNIYYPKKAKSPLKAIVLQCRECMGMDRRVESPLYGAELIRDCPDLLCPLWDFRQGKNPFYKSSMTDEQKKAAGERLSLVREQLKQQAAKNVTA